MHTYSHMSNIVLSCVFCNLGLEHIFHFFSFYFGGGKILLVFCCWITNYHHPRGWKQHEFIISHFPLVRSAAQPNEFSTEGLTWLKSWCHRHSHMKSSVLFWVHPGCWLNAVLVVVGLRALFPAAVGWNPSQPYSCPVVPSTTWEFLFRGQ